MNSSPLISVVVPIYKVEKYIDRCVESLLNQTYKNIEILLIDDGSPDGCPKICDEYARRFQKIRVYHKVNGGLSDARNYGVEKSNSEWIVFVDSDDYVESDYIKDLWDLKLQFDADLVITKVNREYEGKNRDCPENRFEPYLVNNKQGIYEVYGSFRVGWCAYGKLINKSVLMNHPFPDGYYEDCAIMYKIIADSNKIVIADYHRNYHYIYREGSILTSKINHKHYHIYDVCDEFDNFITLHYSDMSVISIILKKSAILQLLTMQSMDANQYNSIFNKYRKLFVKNYSIVMSNKDISNKTKMIYTLLCTNSFVFRKVYNIFAKKKMSVGR